MEHHRISSTLRSLMKSGFNPSLPYGVASFDAGAANQLFSLLSKLSFMPTWVDVDGPAKTLWSQFFPRSKLSNGAFVEGLHALITGTGWSSDLEHKARLLAKKTNILSIAVLDHWVNYESRFVHQGHTCHPDEIWVFDRYAEHIAQKTFPDIPVFLKSNYYLEKEVSKVSLLEEVTSDDILYLLEPVRSCWNRTMPGEFQALDFFLGRMEELNHLKRSDVRLRLHPSEPPNKYDRYFNRNFGPLISLGTQNLTDEISRVKYVAGCQTYAMVIALHAGRTVYSSLPPWAPSCALPHSGIIHLSKT